MKRLNKAMLASIVLAGSLFGEVDKNLIDKIEKLPVFDRLGAKVTDVIDLEDLYAVKAEKDGKLQTVFVSKQLKHLIVGNAIDTHTTEQVKVPVDISSLDEVVAFTYGNGDKEFYLFTDPECPYCNQLDEYLPKLNKDDVKIKMIFYPLPNHKNAKSMSLHVLKQENNESKEKTYFELEKKKYPTKNASDESKKLLDNGITLGNKIGIRGTPTFVNSKGEMLNWVEFLQMHNVEVK